MNVDQTDLQGDMIFVYKTSKREIMVNPRKQITKASKGKAQKTKISAEGPDPKVTTWCYYPNWAVKTVMPFLGNNQIIILQAFVGLREARYQPHLVGPRFEVISPGKGMALV